MAYRPISYQTGNREELQTTVTAILQDPLAYPLVRGDTRRAARSTRGRVTTLELNPEKIALARANLAAAGLDVVVEIIEGLAAETLATLPGPFDLVFLDADRPSYPTYLELVVPKLRPGGILIADNVTSHAHELQDYLRRVKSHPQLFAVTVPIGNGEEIALKLDDRL